VGPLRRTPRPEGPLNPAPYPGSPNPANHAPRKNKRAIGAGIAKEFAAQGASVVVNYVTGKADADAVVEHITSNGANAIAVQGQFVAQTPLGRLGQPDDLAKAAVFLASESRVGSPAT
jgi:NAD(P)-dependent dehydrogenase (short-subunit alcohol dehydrogenase family)